LSAAGARDNTEQTEENVSRSAHEVIDAVDSAAKSGIDAGRRKALEAVSKVEDLESQAELAIEETTRKVSRYVQEKPLQAAGIAFAAGVLTTLIMRKR